MTDEELAKMHFDMVMRGAGFMRTSYENGTFVTKYVAYDEVFRDRSKIGETEYGDE